MSLKDQIFLFSERLLTPLSFIPDPVRVGFGYLKATNSIKRDQQSDPKIAEERIFQQMRKLVIDATRNVEFYRKFYREKSFIPEDMRSIADWKYVPIVTKGDFQKFALEERCAIDVAGKPANTGGTSGAPLEFLLEKNIVSIEWAHMHAIWKARGYRSSQLKLRIGGAYFDSDIPLSFHPRHNEYIVNANCSMDRVVDAVIRLSRVHIFRWVHGYPSMVADFAHTLSRSNEVWADVFKRRLYGVLLGSEFPVPVYRDPISRILSTNIVSWYGHSEMAILAGEIVDGIYQSLPTYGYAEAVLSDSGVEHRLVCTALHNRAHPFIRYDTGDLIQPVSSVGGSLAFKITEGRIGDFILDRSGRKLALTSIIFGRHHTAFDDLLHLQVRQDAPGKITLLVVPRCSIIDMAPMRAGFDFNGLDIDWQLELVSKPLRTKAGKVTLKVSDQS